jgi:hypothetical protein
MKVILPVILVVVTAGLMVLAVFGVGQASGGVATGSVMPGLGGGAKANTPEGAATSFLTEVQRRDWGRAYAALSKSSAVDQQSFTQEWTGANGGLRTFSSLEKFDVRPMHASDADADMRVRLHWTTPVGPLEEVRDLHLNHEGDGWKILWHKMQMASVPSQVVPVTYLRWDLVSGGADDEWGSHNVDAPRVRIISMNAVDSAEGSVVMGEVVNEDTIPAFVNVNATLVDAAGNPIDDESSFDKIAHVLLPKQVSPYRVDFPKISLKNVKNVRMDVKVTLVPASADPVIGVMNQKLDPDSQGKTLLRGELLNQSGQTVNIPHVIASFYDNTGKVVWVADGYVDRALLPQSTEPFAVEIPKGLAGKVQNFHVLVNQYSLEKS